MDKPTRLLYPWDLAYTRIKGVGKRLIWETVTKSNLRERMREEEKPKD